ncbi:MAG: hypothetical protein Q4G30_06415 [Actinomycetaceae bacterium]|nr:hypothetical protein [Actinomycetaceae bacterium]
MYIADADKDREDPFAPLESLGTHEESDSLGVLGDQRNIEQEIGNASNDRRLVSEVPPHY